MYTFYFRVLYFAATKILKTVILHSVKQPLTQSWSCHIKWLIRLFSMSCLGIVPRTGAFDFKIDSCVLWYLMYFIFNWLALFLVHILFSREPVLVITDIQPCLSCLCWVHVSCLAALLHLELYLLMGCKLFVEKKPGLWMINTHKYENKIHELHVQMVK